MRFFKRNNNLSQTVKLSDAQLFYIRINLFVFYIFYNVSLDNILELFLYFNTKTFKYSWKDLGTVETDKGEIWISGVIITYSDVKKRNFGTKFRQLQYRFYTLKSFATTFWKYTSVRLFGEIRWKNQSANDSKNTWQPSSLNSWTVHLQLLNDKW